MRCFFINRNGYFKIGLLWLMCILCSIKLVAKDITFKQYNVEYGVLSANIFAVNQDSEGRLLLGTEEGLNIYDGTNFEVYNRENGLLGKSIFDIKEVNGILYVLSNKELVIIDKGKVKTVPIIDAITINQNSKIFTNQRNDIYVYTMNKLFYLNAEHNLELVAQHISLVLSYKDEIILQDQQHNLQRVQKKGVKKLDTQDEAFIQLNNFIKKIPNAKLILRNSANTRDLSAFYNRIKHLPEATFVEQAIIDKKGRMWIALYPYGLALLTPDNKITIFDEKNGLKNDAISNIYEDRSGTVWISVLNQGLFKVIESDITVVKTKTALGDNRITDLLVYDNKQFAVVNSNRIVKIIDGELISVPMPIDAPQQLDIKLKIANDQLYLIKGTKIYQYVNQQWKSFYNIEIETEEQTLSDLVTINNALFVVISPANKLVNVHTGETLDLQQFKYFSASKSLNGKLYFSSPKGLYVLEEKEGKYYTSYIYKDEEVVKFDTDGKDVIYFNTLEHGLISYQISKNTLVKFPEHILNTRTLVIKKIDYIGDALWIGTSNGYNKIYKENGQYRMVKYDNNRFLHGMSTVLASNAALENGTLYFASNNGIFSLNLNEKVNSTINYPVVFSKYQVIGKKGETHEHLIFNNTLDTVFFPNVSQLIVYFSQLNFSYSSYKEYKLQIEGVHDAPVISSYNRAVIYSLKPGQHKIKVWGKSSNGEWLTEPTVITYTVKEYFYNSWLFKIAISLLVIGLYLFYKIWSAKQTAKKDAWKQQLREEEQAIIRQRTAEDFHDEIGNKLTRLGLLATVAEQKAKNKDYEGAGETINMLKENVNQLYKGAKDIIWSLQPQSEFLFEIVDKIIANSNASLEGTPISFEDNLIFIDEKADNLYHTEKVGTEVGRNLILIFKECINNIIKHSEADAVCFEVSITTESYSFTLKDNGKGYNPQTLHEGNGLRNIEQRAARVKGEVKLSSTAEGTVVTIILSRKKVNNK